MEEIKLAKRRLVDERRLYSKEELEYILSKTGGKCAHCGKPFREVVRNHEGISNAVKFLKNHPNYNRPIKDEVGDYYE